jgi:hypothetical protein
MDQDVFAQRFTKDSRKIEPVNQLWQTAEQKIFIPTETAALQS